MLVAFFSAFYLGNSRWFGDVNILFDDLAYRGGIPLPIAGSLATVMH